jgi:hypothetical protein
MKQRYLSRYDAVVFVGNAELRTFSSLTAVSAFGFESAIHPTTAEDELESWRLADCVPVKTEDLSRIDSDLTQMESDPALNVSGISSDAKSLFKAIDGDGFNKVIPLVNGNDRSATAVDCIGVLINRREIQLSELNGSDNDTRTDGNDICDAGQISTGDMASKVQTALLRQPRTARIGKAASLAVLMASHLDNAKCDPL